MTQSTMNSCAMADANKADADMNKIYQELMARISLDGQAKLQAAQKAWFIYSRRQCEFDTLGTHGGSVNPMIVSECYAKYAVQQMKNLQDQLHCEEGDLSCGSQ